LAEGREAVKNGYAPLRGWSRSRSGGMRCYWIGTSVFVRVRRDKPMDESYESYESYDDSRNHRKSRRISMLRREFTI